jgi:hypothetical protein
MILSSPCLHVETEIDFVSLWHAGKKQQEDDVRVKAPVRVKHNGVLEWKKGLCARISLFMGNRLMHEKITVRQRR